MAIIILLSIHPFPSLCCFYTPFTYCLFIEQYVHILSVRTHLCILFSINCMYIMYILNVFVCIKEHILSFFPFIQCYCIMDILILILVQRGLCGIMAKVMDCDIEITEFELQLHNYVHFQINNFGKGIKPPYFPSYGLNSITMALALNNP